MPTAPARTTLNRQRGMATLAVGLILLIAMTLLTFTVAKVSGVEQRISANDVRAVAAHEAAQAGIEQAIAYLNANLPRIDSVAPATTNPTVPAGWRNSSGSPRWRLCNATTIEIVLPCGDGQVNRYGTAWLTTAANPTGASTLPHQTPLPGSPYTTTVHFLTESTAANVVDVKPTPRIIIIAEAKAKSDPLAANYDPLAGSVVIQQIVQYFSLVNAPSTPIASGGAITLGGNMSVYGDPMPPPSFYLPRDVNGDPIPPSALPQALPPLLGTYPSGSGKPLSVWSGGTVTISGAAAATCVPGAVNCNGQNKLSDNNTAIAIPNDIARNDLKFPPDLFQHIFGVPNNDAGLIQAKSTVLPNCTSLIGTSSGLFWITGNCSIGDNIGSATAPAIIVVDGGDVTMNGNNDFYGLIYLRSGLVGGTVNLVGNPVLYGGLAAQIAPTFTGGGSYTSRYMDFSTIPGNNTGGFAKVPGGWLDAHQ